MPQVNRITSKDIHIEWTPEGAASNLHKVRLYFTASGAITGTFRLWVDGELTAPITYSGTIATLVSNIETAIDAISASNTVWGVADSVADPGKAEITASAAGYHRIQVIWEGTLANVTKVEARVITPGTQTYVLSAEAASFSWEASADAVDMTGISEFEAVQIAVKSSMTFEVSLYEAKQDWGFCMFEGAYGVLTVFETGKVAGSKYFSINAMLDSYGKDYPDHEKVEVTISGMRIGAPLVPFETIYAPA